MLVRAIREFSLGKAVQQSSLVMECTCFGAPHAPAGNLEDLTTTAQALLFVWTTKQRHILCLISGSYTNVQICNASQRCHARCENSLVLLCS